MKRFFALAAFLLASSAAQAQYTFQYGGRTIHVDPDRGTVSIPGVYDNSGHRKRAHKEDGSRKQAKGNAQTPAPASGQADQSPAPASSGTPANASTEPANGSVTPAPANTTALPPPPATDTAALPARQQPAPAGPAPAPAVAAISPAPAPAAPGSLPIPVTTGVAQPTKSPLGLWLTEEKEGKVRIEQCGPNLCGYSVDVKSNQNAEQVLINMKPGKDAKWSGRILDPNTGSTYDSTIAMKGPDTLQVQGCAFSGMFCGGQTWSRGN
jgi:hypothetical protein